MREGKSGVAMLKLEDAVASTVIDRHSVLRRAGSILLEGMSSAISPVREYN